MCVLDNRCKAVTSEGYSSPIASACEASRDISGTHPWNIPKTTLPCMDEHRHDAAAGNTSDYAVLAYAAAGQVVLAL